MQTFTGTTYTQPSPAQLLKRRIVFIVLFFAVFFALFFIYRYLTTARITINTDSDASILVAYDPLSNFAVVGQGSKKLSIRGYDVIYVRVSKGQQITQQAFELKGGRSQAVQLDLQQLVEPTEFGEGSLKNIIVKDGFAYGLNPNTLSINDVASDPDAFAEKFFFGLPTIDRLHWESLDNYTYSSFENGVVASLSQRKTTYSRFSDFAVHNGTYYFLEQNGIFASTDIHDDRSLTKLFDISRGLISSIYVDSGGIYITGNLTQQSPGDDFAPDITASQVNHYNLNGDLLGEYMVDIPDTIDRVLSYQDKLIVVGAGRAHVLDQAETELDPLLTSFLEARDAILVKDSVYFLTDNGVWKLRPDNSYVRLNELAPGLEYVPGSFSALEGKLYFSSHVPADVLRDSGQISPPKVYSIDI